MTKKLFDSIRTVLKKKSYKSDIKSKEKSLNNEKTTKSKALRSIFKKIINPLIGLMSKYSAEQEDILGLDITEKSVKVAQLNNVKNKWILEKLAYKYVDIPAGIPNEKKTEIYIDQIKDALASGKITTVNAAVSLPVSSAIIKVVPAPLMTDEEMARAIEHESLWQNLVQLQEELDS